MENDVQNQVGGNSGASEDGSAKPAARVKKMRGWLGVKSEGRVGHFDDGGGFVDYGEGHSGWNR